LTEVGKDATEIKLKLANCQSAICDFLPADAEKIFLFFQKIVPGGKFFIKDFSYI